MSPLLRNTCSALTICTSASRTKLQNLLRGREGGAKPPSYTCHVQTEKAWKLPHSLPSSPAFTRPPGRVTGTGNEGTGQQGLLPGGSCSELGQHRECVLWMTGLVHETQPLCAKSSPQSSRQETKAHTAQASREGTCCSLITEATASRESRMSL